MEGLWGLMLRMPESLYTALVRECGEETARSGKRVSLKQVIVEILTAGTVRLDRGTTKNREGRVVVLTPDLLRVLIQRCRRLGRAS